MTRLTTATLALLTLLLVAAAPAQAAGCKDSDLVPAKANVSRVRAAVLCLHNAQRAAHGLGSLRANPELRRAARRHSRDMVSRNYFSHVTPAGATVVDRVVRTDYIDPHGSWSLGENIAWGTGSLATPRAIMRSWMRSPGHRRNILDGRYRELGLGISIGTPGGHDGGATFTANFGTRK